MGNHREKSSSGDKFSFPIVPAVYDQGFEFGCITPGSQNSPADHLFFNGRLLPHAFPCQPTNSISFSPSISRTSSVSSKRSFMSSRSNSTNSSRSSRCSSARTSTSEAAYDRKVSTQSKFASKTRVPRDQYCYQAKKPAVLTPHYSSSQRWQFITPAPASKYQSSLTRKNHKFEREELKSNKKTKNWANANPWFCWRFFRLFVSACKECHAIKPSST